VNSNFEDLMKVCIIGKDSYIFFFLIVLHPLWPRRAWGGCAKTNHLFRLLFWI